MRQLSWLQQRWIRSVHRTFSRKHSSTFSRAVLPRQYSISTILQAKPQQVSCQYFHSSTVLCSQTIFALSSGHGKCGVAVIRVSGPKCRQAVLYMTRDDKLPPPRVAVLKRFSDAKTLQPIDRGLLLWFPGPESFTGEDCCEFHIHGGSAVLAAMFNSLSAINGLRHAEAGEFTKRAFERNKLDLTEVEGLADLIHAETEAQRRQALRQMEGALSQLYTEWRTRLLKCCADVEAFIDFSEEENIEDGIMDKVESELKSITTEIEHHLHDNRCGERLRSGVNIAIIGQPNVGKSSLLNIICERPAAIVSPMAGTTRDVVETALNLGGYPVILSDTAGLRDTDDIVESEGVRRAINRARNADIRIVLLDVTQNEHQLFLAQSPGGRTNGSHDKTSLIDFFRQHLKELGISNTTSETPINNSHASSSETKLFDQESNEEAFDPKDWILLFNKADLYKHVGQATLQNGASHEKQAGSGELFGLTWACISCVSEQGFDDFLNILLAKVKDMCGDLTAGNPSLTQARHRDHLTQCVVSLNDYQTMQHRDVVLAANCLHLALRHIGKITGKITSEEILDVVFRDFCIGK